MDLFCVYLCGAASFARVVLLDAQIEHRDFDVFLAGKAPGDAPEAQPRRIRRSAIRTCIPLDPGEVFEVAEDIRAKDRLRLAPAEDAPRPTSGPAERMVRFTARSSGGEAVYVLASRVSALRANHDGDRLGTDIYFANAIYQSVRETPDEVIAALYG
jgi:hypothetical protein